MWDFAMQCMESLDHFWKNPWKLPDSLSKRVYEKKTAGFSKEIHEEIVNEIYGRFSKGMIWETFGLFS